MANPSHNPPNMDGFYQTQPWQARQSRQEEQYDILSRLSTFHPAFHAQKRYTTLLDLYSTSGISTPKLQHELSVLLGADHVLRAQFGAFLDAPTGTDAQRCEARRLFCEISGLENAPVVLKVAADRRDSGAGDGDEESRFWGDVLKRFEGNGKLEKYRDVARLGFVDGPEEKRRMRMLLSSEPDLLARFDALESGKGRR